MKNFLLGLNIVLVIAVAVLFYLHFKPGANKPSGTAAAVSNVVPAEGAFSIAYFEMDSIENNYELLKDVRNELKLKENALSSQLNAIKKSYMERVNQFQREAPNMTQEKGAAMEQNLVQEQKVIQNKEQAMGLELQDASFKKMQDVNKRIEDFLKEYNKDKNYTYIMAHQPGTFYYKDARYDITAEVLNGLNAAYKKN